MNNKVLHLYQVDIDPNTRKAAFGFMKRKSNGVENLKIKNNPGKLQFFVIIDPVTASCVYNRVI